MFMRVRISEDEVQISCKYRPKSSTMSSTMSTDQRVKRESRRTETTVQKV